VTLLISIVLALVAVQQAPPLRIVVIEGEDAVNVILQRTAVAPLVEVRDRNDQPVAGAVVNFVVRNGRATFGGARTLSVTTNAAGRAAATGFAPSGTGAVQIGATATFQGQTAAVTIAQTNVLTQAGAASTASAGGAGNAGTATGGAGSSGGGVSATTVGIVGGAVAGGALLAAQQQPGESTPATVVVYESALSSTVDVTFAAANAPGFSCTNIDRLAITISVQLDSTSGAGGTMSIRGGETRAPGTCQLSEDNNYSSPNKWALTAPVSGSQDNMSSTATARFPYSNPRVTGETNEEFSFSGRVVGDAIAGVLTFTTRNVYQNSNGVLGTGTGSARHDVTLSKR
jgi:hypothetical protein